MTFQPGNQLAARVNRHRPFREALDMEIALAEQGKPCPAPHGSLRYIARTMLTKAANGDPQMMSMLLDRIDGKVPQAVVGDSEHDPIAIRAIAWLPGLDHPQHAQIDPPRQVPLDAQPVQPTQKEHDEREPKLQATDSTDPSTVH